MPKAYGEVRYEDGPTILFKAVEQRDWKGTKIRVRHHPVSR